MDQVEEIEHLFEELALLLPSLEGMENDIEFSKAIDRRNTIVVQLSKLLSSE